MPRDRKSKEQVPPPVLPKSKSSCNLDSSVESIDRLIPRIEEKKEVSRKEVLGRGFTHKLLQSKICCFRFMRTRICKNSNSAMPELDSEVLMSLRFGKLAKINQLRLSGSRAISYGFLGICGVGTRVTQNIQLNIWANSAKRT